MITSRINRKLGISIIVATVFMLATSVATAAISASAYTVGPIIHTHPVYPSGPRCCVLLLSLIVLAIRHLVAENERKKKRGY